MAGKIALEEHFVTPALEDLVLNPGWPEDAFRRTLDRLEDVAGERLELMDRHGIAMSVLSLASDGIQGLDDASAAVTRAREANDALAEVVAARPDRFAGFAAVALQDPSAAAAEAERAVRELGFQGVLVNGYSNGAPYYDDERYLGFWEALEGLGVPFYLHPRNPLESMREIYRGRPELLGPTWAFGVETATHALRLIVSGLFDRFPSLQVVLGHLGEGLPFQTYRLEQRLKRRADVSLRRLPTVVLRENFFVTVSGNYHTPSLVGVLSELGPDRVMFAVDHPFEDVADGADWFDALDLDDDVRSKIAAGNAQRLLQLSTV
jgi:predicted TIM-barrel fold metal-dependent hydrolase